MYNPFLMQQIDALSLPSDTALVTFVPLLWEIQCTDTAGQPLIDPILPGGPGVFENAAELLTAAHTKGAGVWRGNLPLLAGQRAGVTTIAMKALHALPEGLFSAERKFTGRWEVRLGNLALASRRPTPEEIEQVGQGTGMRAAFVRRWGENLAADTGKRHLTDFDHMVIHVADQNSYYLPLDSPDALVAARFLELVCKTPAKINSHLPEIDSLVRRIWSWMPLAERALFADAEVQLNELTNDKVAKAIQRILPLANAMHISEPFGWGRHLRAQIYARVEFSEDPLPPSREDVFSRLELSDSKPEGRQPAEDGPTFSDEDMETVRQVMQLLLDRRVSQSTAHKVIEVTTDPGYKNALEAWLIESPDHTINDFSAVAGRLRRAAKGSLGPAFKSAYLHRIISGDRKTGSQCYVRQVGGQVSPSVTRPNAGRLEWRIIPPRVS